MGKDLQNLIYIAFINFIQCIQTFSRQCLENYQQFFDLVLLSGFNASQI